MKITITLLALSELILFAPANAAEPLYAFETQRAVTPFRDAPVSKSDCEAQLLAFARDEAKLARFGEPMKANCVKVND